MESVIIITKTTNASNVKLLWHRISKEGEIIQVRIFWKVFLVEEKVWIGPWHIYRTCIPRSHRGMYFRVVWSFRLMKLKTWESTNGGLLVGKCFFLATQRKVLGEIQGQLYGFGGFLIAVMVILSWKHWSYGALNVLAIQLILQNERMRPCLYSCFHRLNFEIGKY